MRVLLVDDDELLRTTLTRDFERAGFAVDCAADGERGEFLGSTEHYDIVVLEASACRGCQDWRSCGGGAPRAC